MRSIPLVLAIAVLAGCGSPHPATFEQDYNAALRVSYEAMKDFDAVVADAEGMRQAARGCDDAATRLRELEAPSGAEDELDETVYAMEKLAEALSAAADQYPDFEAWVGESLQVNAERLEVAEDAMHVALDRMS